MPGVRMFDTSVVKGQTIHCQSVDDVKFSLVFVNRLIISAQVRILYHNVYYIVLLY